jgi:hypothetical protein
MRYAGLALPCALLTVPYCDISDLVAVRVALVFLCCFINRLP